MPDCLCASLNFCHTASLLCASLSLLLCLAACCLSASFLPADPLCLCDCVCGGECSLGCADGSKSPLHQMDSRLSRLQHDLDSQNPSHKKDGGVLLPVLLFYCTSTILWILMKCQIDLVLLFLSMISHSSHAALTAAAFRFCLFVVQSSVSSSSACAALYSCFLLIMQ